MHQCLNCSKPCVETAIFCDECRASLLKRQQSSGADQGGHDARPARVFKRLYAFLILGAISLITGGILLAANILHHHTLTLTDMAVIAGTGVVLSPHIGLTNWPGETQTPAASPFAGTSTSTAGTSGMGTGTGTGTTITSTTTPGAATPVPGATTPTPTSIPATTPTTAPNTCVLQIAPAHLSFTATLLQPNPPAQSVTLKTTGPCGKPVTWTASADTSWIQLSSSSGSDNGSGSTLTVSVHSNHIVGASNAHITFNAIDSNGITLQNSPQTISVTLTILG